MHTAPGHLQNLALLSVTAARKKGGKGSVPKTTVKPSALFYPRGRGRKDHTEGKATCILPPGWGRSCGVCGAILTSVTFLKEKASELTF